MVVSLLRDQQRVSVAGGQSDADSSVVLPFLISSVTGRVLIDAASTGVTSVSVVSANGLAGTVATATTTPAITLSTTINAPALAGNGTAISAATTTGTGSTLALSTSPVLVTPTLGTPTSGTLTNCTGLPVSGIAASTVTALGVGSIELGAASDTTLSRSSAGVLAVEGVVIPSITSTNTLTNKRITRRLTTTNAPGATPTTNTDNVDVMNFTGLGTAITSMTTNLSGTPGDGDLLEFRFLDDGTARGITWGASFASTTVTLPTTTVISTCLRVGFEWRAASSKWECVATA